MAWTNPRTWNIGETVTKAMLDEQIRDNMRILQGGTARQGLVMNAGATAPEYVGAIGALVTKGIQSISHDTSTDISFDTEVVDTAALFDAGSPTLLTLPYAGLWVLAANVQWGADADGMRILQFSTTNCSGGQLSKSTALPGTAGYCEHSLMTIVTANAAATVKARVYHDAGAALNATTSFLGAVFLGPTA